MSDKQDVISQRVSQLMLSSVIDLGIGKITDNHQALIELSQEYLAGEISIPLNPDKTLLELPYQLIVQDPHLDSVKKLSEKGYEIVLDNYRHDKNQSLLLNSVHFASINVNEYMQPQKSGAMLELLDELNHHDIKVIARNIEFQDQIEELRSMGFSYFQGNFLCRPQLTTVKCMPTNRLAVLRLLAMMLDAETTIEELDAIISSDVGLSYRVLKLVNSAAYIKSKTIDSLSQAIIYLGMDSIKALASIISISGINDKPDELMSMALVRAKMCELLAHHVNESKRSNMFFTAGLLSITDVILNESITNVVNELPICDELNAALVSYDGIIGIVLKNVRAYEECHLKEVYLNEVPVTEINQCLVKAIDWSNEIVKGLSI